MVHEQALICLWSRGQSSQQDERMREGRIIRRVREMMLDLICSYAPALRQRLYSAYSALRMIYDETI